ncbi:MAG: hypothetical protein JXB30_02565 [Anaerolineae bacterium]|nr:hypothetical protein [Anaerolineae bacterium]
MLRYSSCSLNWQLRCVGLLAGAVLLVTACQFDNRMPPSFSSSFFCVIPENDPATNELTTTPPWPPCDLGIYVADVTVPDGTTVAPGETFVKTWRISNGGTCTWTPDYWFVFARGDQMAGPNAIALTDDAVAPDEAIEVSVTLTAPKKEGRYEGEWTLCNANKEAFGFGHGMGQLLNIWVRIEVAAPTASPGQP